MLALSFEMGTENKICPRSSFLNDNEEMGMKHRQNVSLGRNYCSDEGEAWFVELCLWLCSSWLEAYINEQRFSTYL